MIAESEVSAGAISKISLRIAPNRSSRHFIRTICSNVTGCYCAARVFSTSGFTNALPLRCSNWPPNSESRTHAVRCCEYRSATRTSPISSALRGRVTEHLAQLEREHLIIRQGRQLIVRVDKLGSM